MGVFQRLSFVLVVCCGCLLADICPRDWHRFGESCYFLVTQSVNWYEANRTCAESRANLAVPNTQSEQDFVWDLFLKAIDQKPSTSLWIACNDIVEEGNWQHCPLKGETDAYENWADNQPNSYNNADCGVMRVDMNGTWDDQHCTTNTRYSVCELPVYNCRLTPQCLLHHAMEELHVRRPCGKDCCSHPLCHTSTLENCCHQLTTGKEHQ